VVMTPSEKPSDGLPSTASAGNGTRARSKKMGKMGGWWLLVWRPMASPRHAIFMSVELLVSFYIL
jgi:hypothetical protein